MRDAAARQGRKKGVGFYGHYDVSRRDGWLWTIEGLSAEEEVTAWEASCRRWTSVFFNTR